MAGVIGKILQPYWRLTRGLTLGAQGVVIDQVDRVLLVKHGYRPGWHFPGGGVEKGETLEQALARELHEEAGVKISGPVELHGIHANFKAFPGDHIALYLVRNWERPSEPKPSAEIVAQDFFSLDQLPADATSAVPRRLNEIFGNRSPDQWW